MNRSQKIRMAYEEIRLALGDDVSALEALECASLLLQQFEADAQDWAVEDASEVPFCLWDTDRVFLDDGMRLRECEPWLLRGMEAEAEYESLAFRNFMMINEQRGAI